MSTLMLGPDCARGCPRTSIIFIASAYFTVKRFGRRPDVLNVQEWASSFWWYISLWTARQVLTWVHLSLAMNCIKARLILFFYTFLGKSWVTQRNKNMNMLWHCIHFHSLLTVCNSTQRLHFVSTLRFVFLWIHQKNIHYVVHYSYSLHTTTCISINSYLLFPLPFTFYFSNSPTSLPT